MSKEIDKWVTGENNKISIIAVLILVLILGSFCFYMWQGTIGKIEQPIIKIQDSNLDK